VSNTTIVCTLSEAKGRTRREELRDGLVREIRAARELRDGIAFRFDTSVANREALEDFIRVEEGCCGFATYGIRPERNALWLEIRGPDGTRDLFAPMARGVELTPLAAKRGRSLSRWGWRSTLTAFVLVVLCETPFLALGFAAVGVGGAASFLGGWLDGLAIILLAGGLSAFAVAFWRKRNAENPT
jgi:hypothetical protein